VDNVKKGDYFSESHTIVRNLKT